MAPQHDGGFRVSVQTARVIANACQHAEHTLAISLCLRQTQFFIGRLQLIWVAVILLLASLRGIPSVSLVPLLAGVRLKGEGCWGAREPAVMDFIFPSSAILRISTKQRKLMYLFSICTAQQVPKLTGIKVIDF